MSRYIAKMFQNPLQPGESPTTEPAADLYSTLRTKYLRALAIGMSDSELKSLRVDLAKENQLSASKLGAALAWLTIWAKEATAEVAASCPEGTLLTKLAPRDLAVLYYKRSINSDITEQIASVAAQLETSPDVVTKILDAYATRLNQNNTGKNTDDGTHEDLLSSDKLPQRNIGATGDSLDYDFPVKRVWREMWFLFLRKHFSASELATCKVICLPGRAVMHEVQGYLDLGIKPENIVAVEGGSPEARAEFLENCKKIGIRGYAGRLEDVVPTLSDRFSIISYDFHGPISEEKYHILRNTPSAAKAAVLVNILGRRENSSTQYDLLWNQTIRTTAHLNRHTSRKDTDAIYRDAMSHGTRIELAELRPAFITGQLIGSLSLARKDASNEYYNRLKSLQQHNVFTGGDIQDLEPYETLENLKQNCLLLANKIGSSIERSFNTKQFGDITVAGVTDLCMLAWAKVAAPAAIERYNYRSEGGKGSPFWSAFQLMTFPEKHQDRLRPVANFMLEVLVALDRSGNQPWSIGITKNDGSLLALDDQIRPRHTLLFRIGKKDVAKINLGTFFASYQIATDILQGLGALSPKECEHIPTVALN